MNQKNRDMMRQAVNIVVLVFTLVMNSLANALPLNGRATGEISDALPSFFTPAGFTFSVWGVIYLGLIGFAIYQALPQQKDNFYLRRIGYLPALANLLNGFWIVAWHYAYYGLSVVIMVSLLVTLLIVYIRLEIGLPSQDAENGSLANLLFVFFPFSIYFAWINVATVANMASVANFAGWAGFGLAEAAWSVIMIGIVAVVALLLLVSRANAPYAAVLIWALIGIQANQPQLVGTAAVVAAVIIAVATAIGWYRYWQAAKTAKTPLAGIA